MAQTATIVSCDEEEFQVPPHVVPFLGTVANALQDVASDDEIKIMVPEVTGASLLKMLEFCKEQALHPGAAQGETDDAGQNSEKTKADVPAWQAEFCEKLDLPLVFQLIQAANFLDASALLNACCACVANKIKNKSPAQIRETFQIQNDFTPEEEQYLCMKNPYADEWK